MIVSSTKKEEEEEKDIYNIEIEIANRFGLI